MVELGAKVQDRIDFEENDLLILAKATEYFKEDRYPNPNYFLPPREEIKEVLDFTAKLFDRVCGIVEIDKSELV